MSAICRPSWRQAYLMRTSSNHRTTYRGLREREARLRERKAKLALASVKVATTPKPLTVASTAGYVFSVAAKVPTEPKPRDTTLIVTEAYRENGPRKLRKIVQRRGFEYA